MDTLPREVSTVSKYELEQYKQGRRVGCYLLGKTVGEGSFAKVKEGVHIVTGEKVAVKIIDKKRAREDRYICKNLRREARILQLVRHAHIIQLLEVLETDHYYYLVMEFCAGGELLDYICSKKRLDESTAKRLVAQLVSAVDAMHQSGIVHRDLKIENFLLNENEDLKIIDFGLSNTMPSSCLAAYEKSGVFPQLLNTHCGSPAYAAPELLAQKQYGPQVDVWSIGINMYAMLTGFLPYMMEPFNVMEMYEKMMQRKMTPVPGFLSKECRDLLMRLLEPVPEWRITLKQVMKHRWFTGSDYIPRCTSLGDMMYSKKELCESVLSYMKHVLKIKTKDTINAVVTNRAVHASAIYHLLVRRLDRYLKERKLIENKQFSKVEVIKKASLVNDGTTSKSKKFSFRGRKIETSSRSQPALLHEITNSHTDETILNDSLNDSYDKIYYDENNNNITKPLEHVASNTKRTKDSQNQIVRRHKRSASSADSTIMTSNLINSLTCSKEDLGVLSRESKESQDTSKDEESFVTSRKKSVDGILDSPNNNDKEIDVTLYLNEESQRKKMCIDHTDEKKPFLRRKSSSIDLSIHDGEDNFKGQNEPSPGWAITKIVKQPPLKSENNIRETTSGNSAHQIHPENKSSSPVNLNRKVAAKTFSDPGNEKETQVVETPRRHSERQRIITRPETTGKQRTIRRPETSEKLRTIRRPVTPDFNHNFSTVHSDAENLLELTCNNNVISARTSSVESPPEISSRDTPTPELEEILRNVRYINQNLLSEKVTDIDRLLSTPESENLWKPPDKETMRTIHDSKIRVRRVYRVEDCDSNNSSPVTTSPWALQKSDSETKDENNNNTQRTRIEAPPRGLVKSRMSKLEGVEKEKEKPRLKDENIVQVNSKINKIVSAKKTLELNVRQFAQFKSDENQKNGVNAVNTIESVRYNQNAVNTMESVRYNQNKGLVGLQPLEINFNFKIRKKKPYNQKQQTRSLTDLAKASNDDSAPCQTQLLSPKPKYGGEDVESPGSAEKSDIDTHHTNNMANNNKVKQKTFTTIVKITSLVNKSSKNNKAKIYINAKKDSKSQNSKTDSQKKTTPNSDKHTTLKLTNRYKDDVFKLDETNDYQRKRDSSVDSGYFGNNYSSSTDDENHVSNVYVETSSKKSEKLVPHETHQAKYRCQPIYKPEVTTTARIYNHDSSGDLDVIREELNEQKNSARVRRSGSLNAERTQERLAFIPRSAEFKRNILKQHRDEQNKREQNYSTHQATSDDIAMKKKVRSQSSKQYPIERTVVGSSSPKFHRTASFGMTRSTSRSLPVSPCPSPTLFDADLEKEKILLFTHALERAAWRRRESYSAMNNC